jgi:hypothetical protein
MVGDPSEDVEEVAFAIVGGIGRARRGLVMLICTWGCKVILTEQVLMRTRIYIFLRYPDKRHKGILVVSEADA